MLLSYNLGITGVILRMKLLDSSSTTGAGLTGLTTASSGIRISTIADNESASTFYTASGLQTIATLGTFVAPSANSARFQQVDATNHPGVYEIQLANARYGVTSSRTLLVSVTGATNLAQADAVIQLTATTPPDNFSAMQIDANGRVQVQSGTASGQISLFTGQVTVATNNDKAGYSLVQSFPPNFDILAISGVGAVTATFDTSSTISSVLNVINPVSIDWARVVNQTGSVTLSATTMRTVQTASALTTNNDKTNYALSASQTFNMTGNITGSMSGAVGATVLVLDKTNYSLSATGIDAILQRSMTEAYAADGAAMNLSQFSYMLWNFFAERAVVSTTMTVFGLDGTTGKMTFTLNNATTPTALTRAT